MKILILSNTPTMPTGYGMQCAQLATRLQDAGHQVAVAATYGQQGSIGEWRGVRLYPSGWAEQSADVVHEHALHWFDNDPHGGWIITLMDVWAQKNPLLGEFNVLAWTMVDHDPVPPMVVDWLRRTGARPVACSKFGQAELNRVGLDAGYIPLSVDTTVFKPTPTLNIGGRVVDARTFLELPQQAFVVGMVAMNKDPGDRKGFSEAFHAFAKFHAERPDSVLYVHTEPMGIQGGIDLTDVATLAGIPNGAIRFPSPYAYRLGFSREMMAAAYTAMDVLLAPSRGEGFCVPLIEAQACGVPVIVSPFTAQPELLGVGWALDGQVEYEPTQRSCYFRAHVDSVVDRLHAAYDTLNGWTEEQSAACVEFAAQYDCDAVFERYWLPLLAELDPTPVADKPLMERVDVIVPFLRPENERRLSDSFMATAGPKWDGHIVIGERGDAGKAPTRTYAENVNEAYRQTTADWVLVVGDDCEFLPGWFEAAREISDRWDVIGTNDSEEGRVRNPDVAAGRHADHFLIRRSYVEEVGASLDGPGVVMPTAYRHWFVDKEVIGLARARGVYGHAHDCRIVHHHPGYDGDEKAREADPVYMAAVDAAERDRKMFMSRAPLIENHRVPGAR